MNPLRRILGSLLVGLWALLDAPAHAQMLSPDIDRPDEPFCYYSKPTDEIGVMDGRSGTLVSPEGFLYTGWGELMFFTGNPPVPVDQRVKTLQNGYLPIVEYQFVRDSVRYAFTAFAGTLDGNPESPLVNFVRVQVSNPGHARRTAFLSTGIRYQGVANTTWGVADNRFGRPHKAKILGQFSQAGTEFSRDWVYAFEKDALLRDSAVVYTFDPAPGPTRLMTLKTGYNEPQDLKPSKLYVGVTTPVGIVRYALTLEAGASHALYYKMPYEPMKLNHPQIASLRAADFDTYVRKTAAFWDEIIARGIDINVPERKVVDAFKANLIYDLIARNKEEGSYIQKVNDFNYHAFWLRDASYLVRMYDVSGYHDIARQCLDFFARWQQPDGNFVSQGGQYDGWGQTLWAYGQHFRITGDREFAAKVYPAVLRAVEWLKQARKSDPYHLMPATTPGDNEDISGHVTGHNFIALGGLKNAIALAEGLGKDGDARVLKAEYDDYLSALRRRLQQVTAKTGGYIPPGLDSLGGSDWGNMESVYPEQILDPADPLVTATLRTTRGKYQEGIMTYDYGRYLHHYLTMSNTETEVIRGDGQTAMEEFYAVLMHTSATHAGFEFSILPWGTRDFMMNLSPHGWFAARFRTLLRNMMVREQGTDLHLFSCLSPEWIGEGKTVAVHRAPTTFGTVNADIVCSAGGARLTLANSFRSQPAALILHLPWFTTVSAVEADGKNLEVRDGAVRLPSGARLVSIAWTRKPNTAVLNYDRTVADYKQEYRKRYDRFLSEGK